MNIADYQNSKIEFIQKIFQATESSLSEHNFQKNLQSPELVKMVVVKMGLSFDTVKEVDPYVRAYVKNHPVYVSSRGRNGGITLKDKKMSKNKDKAARAAAKEEAKEIVETRLLESSKDETSTIVENQQDSIQMNEDSFSMSSENDDIDFPVED
jgi:hypothetical protein